MKAFGIIIIIILVALFSGGGDDKKQPDCAEFVTRSGNKKTILTKQDSLIIQIQHNLKIIEEYVDNY